MNNLWRKILIPAVFFVSAACSYKSDSKTVAREILSGKTLHGLEAGVACAHPEAARIGAEILAEGGNAVDASIAVQWALAVCYPNAGNIGGGGFMTARMSNGALYSLDFRETAPAAAGRDFYLEEDGSVSPGKSTDTHYAAGVPGTVRGLYAASDSLGTMNQARLIRPAVELAERGFPVTALQAELLNRFAEVFTERNPDGTAFTAAGGVWNEGDTLRQPALAATLKRIAENGAEEFYTGETAKMILRETDRRGTWFTPEDLAGYRPLWRSPLVCIQDSVRIIAPGPPSSGGVALCQMLEMGKQLRIDTLAHNSTAYIHRLTEIQRRVYADRAAYLGDPDFVHVPVKALLNPEYLSERTAGIDLIKATPSTAVREGVLPNESPETTHLSVIDAKGNAVSVTTTLNGNFGSKIIVSEAGFLLNNEMDDFSIKPGVPNMFGLTGGEANAVAPGKRMLSSMTPVIVEIHGKPFLAAGSPGGSTIITSVLQTVLNTVYFNMPIDEATAAGKFHSQWLPDRISFEKNRFYPEVLDSLRSAGHEIHFYPSLGRTDAVQVMPDGSITASGDPRADNTASGIKP